MKEAFAPLPPYSRCRLPTDIFAILWKSSTNTTSHKNIIVVQTHIGMYRPMRLVLTDILNHASKLLKRTENCTINTFQSNPSKAFLPKPLFQAIPLGMTYPYVCSPSASLFYIPILINPLCFVEPIHSFAIKIPFQICLQHKNAPWKRRFYKSTTHCLPHPTQIRLWAPTPNLTEAVEYTMKSMSVWCYYCPNLNTVLWVGSCNEPIIQSKGKKRTQFNWNTRVLQF